MMIFKQENGVRLVLYTPFRTFIPCSTYVYNSPVHYLYEFKDTTSSPVHYLYEFKDTTSSPVHYLYEFKDTTSSPVHYLYEFKDTTSYTRPLSLRV